MLKAIVAQDSAPVNASCYYLVVCANTLRAMPVTIEATYSVSLNGSIAWKIGSDLIQKVGDDTFVKIKPYDQGLVRMLCGDLLELPTRTRFTIAKCAGYQELMSLRNEAAQALARQDGAQSSGVALLFGVGKKKQKVRRLLNASRMKDLRDSPESCEVNVPGYDAAPALLISCVRAVHPGDELAVRLDQDTIEHVAMFIRSRGVSLDDLTSSRAYGSEGAKGVWRMGSAGIVQRIRTEKVPSDDEGELGIKRFKTMNQKGAPADGAVPLEDDPK